MCVFNWEATPPFLPCSLLFDRLLRSSVLLALWLKLLNLLISHQSSDLCTGSRLMNAFNINSSNSPTKFSLPAKPYTIFVQSTRRTRSSSTVTLSRPSVSSSSSFLRSHHITTAVFHSRLKTHLFHKSFPPVFLITRKLCYRKDDRAMRAILVDREALRRYGHSKLSEMAAPS